MRILLTRYRVKKLLEAALASPNQDTPEALAAVAHLKELGKEAIPQLLTALQKARRPQPLEKLLGTLLDDTTLPMFCKGMAHSDRRVVARVVKLLAQSQQYDPHLLLDFFAAPDISKADLVRILVRHASALQPERVLALLEPVGLGGRSFVFRLVDAMATESMIPALAAQIHHPDAVVRRHIVQILSRFSTPSVQEILLGMLSDPDKSVQLAVLDGLASLSLSMPIDPICQLLRSPDHTLRRHAIETIIRVNDPYKADQLLDFLRHESDVVCQGVFQMVRRAVTTRGDVTHLLKSINASGWWARIRVAEPQSGMATTENAASPSPTAEPPRESARQGAIPPVRARNTGSGRAGDSGRILDAKTLQPGDFITDRYRVIRHVGHGAFGVVLLVEDMFTLTRVILKFLHPHLSQDHNVLERFVQEFHYTRQIVHDNIIRTYDLITVGRSHAIVMEYFPSRSLARELKPGVSLDLLYGLKLLCDLCRGMVAAHQLHIIHRDLKPSNILIGHDQHVKIVDFGLAITAKAPNVHASGTRVFVGTPAYIAPEVLQRQRTDIRTDIYSLGVIMYEMYTGQLPYSGKDNWTILQQIVDGDSAPPSVLNPALPLELEFVILKAMAPNPARRYQSMDDLLQSLEAVRAMQTQ